MGVPTTANSAPRWLRHHLPDAVSCGLLCGGLIAALIWCLILVSDEYKVSAEFHINTSLKPRISRKRSRFDTTHHVPRTDSVKSPFVLASAARKPNVASLSVLREIQYPVQWLEENLHVESPAPEIRRISLSGESPVSCRQSSMLSANLFWRNALQRRKPLVPTSHGFEDPAGRQFGPFRIAAGRMS